MSVQDEARRQIADQKIVDAQLGKRSLKERLARFLKGESNFRNMGKKVAVEKERLKLAKALARRRASGKRPKRSKK